MRKDDLLSRIAIDSGVCAGKPVVKGTRITVELKIDLLGGGWLSEDILEEYDHLSAGTFGRVSCTRARC